MTVLILLMDILVHNSYDYKQKQDTISQHSSMSTAATMGIVSVHDAPGCLLHYRIPNMKSSLMNRIELGNVCSLSLSRP